MSDHLSKQLDAARYFEFAGVMVIVLDRAGKVTLVNRKACAVLGVEESEIVGRSWFDDFIPARDREEVWGAFRRIMAGDVEPVEYFESPVLTRGGEERLVEWHNAALRDGEGRITATLSTGTDVTERRRMEEELIRRKSLARLGEMASVVAHEVRNPLAGIRGALQNLAAGAAERQRVVIEEVISEIDSLNEVVEDLLFFARPSAPRLSPFRAIPLIEEGSTSLRRDPAFSGIEVSVAGEDLVVRGDAKQLRRVILNLLLNAAQAMEGEGRISVDVAEADGRCRIRISDTGPGIPPDVREKVFEPFYTTRHRGTGLGLTAARASVEAHGGDVSLEFPAGGGTRVVLHVPLDSR